MAVCSARSPSSPVPRRRSLARHKHRSLVISPIKGNQARDRKGRREGSAYRNRRNSSKGYMLQRVYGLTHACMGQSLRKLFDSFCPKEMKVVMLGLDAAGKTTILYRLHIGEVLPSVPTIGFNVEKVEYKNITFTVWDVGGQDKLRPLWRQYLNNSDALIYVVDSTDRGRIGVAKEEFQAIVNDTLMLNSVILVLANKQDMKGAMSPGEVCRGLGLQELKNRRWHGQGACAITGEGLREGLAWLATALRDVQEWGTSVRY